MSMLTCEARVSVFRAAMCWRQSARDTAVDMDYIAKESAGIGRIGRRLDDALAMGSTAMSELREDDALFKRAQRRLLDIGASLGLSQGVLRLIDRRERGDRLIVLGGIVLVLAALFVSIWYLRPYFRG
eukprot:c1371_g1_i2.p4 GENE.c1371_g1_i2~~c1371_g1_i2.p4  ORF type:complete len:128 (+),score=17.57 c1371_g1_i2:425-808(+)